MPARFCPAAWAQYRQVAFVLDPASGLHLLEQGFVEAAPRFVVDVNPSSMPSINKIWPKRAQCIILTVNKYC